MDENVVKDMLSLAWSGGGRASGNAGEESGWLLYLYFPEMG